MTKTSLGLEENIEGVLCYLLGFITGIAFYLLEKENKFVRFHAMQSIIVFGALFILQRVFILLFIFIPFLGLTISWLLGLLGFVLWIILMMKAYQGEMFKVPIAGEIAEKYV